MTPVTDPTPGTDPTPVTPRYRYRESWLNACAYKMLQHVFRASAALDRSETAPPVRITCGYTTKGANTDTIGQCIYPESSADKTTEIIVSIKLDDPLTVAATLAHEMIHAIRPKAKHGKDFRRMALRIGLCGKMTATRPGPAFAKRMEPILNDIGPYPHAALLYGGPPPKDDTRTTTRTWLKALCPCGYSVRIHRNWIESVGPPHCPDHGEMRIIT